MSKKSVAILGKGPSVSRCTREFIDKFNVVVGCGRPLIDGYEHLVGSRLHYDFSNRTSTPYTQEQMSRYGVREHIDTGGQTPIRENFSFKDLDPSTGILAFDLFVHDDSVDSIALVGFDLFQHMEKMYYFKNEEFDPALKWLWDNGTYDSQGRLTEISGHNLERTYEYLNHMFDSYPEKNFYIISSYPFEEKPNLTIM